jgi:uncharacterized protein DUF6152
VDVPENTEEEIPMKKGFVAFFALALGVLALAAPAVAHHSFAAEFDANKPVTLKGFVTKIEWTNPHVWFYLNVKKDDGTTENWGFEMGPPHGLQGRGWTRTTMKLGDQIEVAGTMAKNGSKRVNARSVTMVATGQRLGAASSEGTTP